jgi:hypothetical protein
LVLLLQLLQLLLLYNKLPQMIYELIHDEQV